MVLKWLQNPLSLVYALHPHITLKPLNPYHQRHRQGTVATAPHLHHHCIGETACLHSKPFVCICKHTATQPHTLAGLPSCR